MATPPAATPTPLRERNRKAPRRRGQLQRPVRVQDRVLRSLRHSRKVRLPAGELAHVYGRRTTAYGDCITAYCTHQRIWQPSWTAPSEYTCYDGRTYAVGATVVRRTRHASA